MRKNLSIYRKYFQNERFRSLFSKNFKMLLLFLFPIIVLFFVVSFILYSGARDAEIENLLLTNFTQSTHFLDLITEAMERDLLVIQNDSNISRILCTSREESEREIEYLKSWPESASLRLRLMCAGNRLYDSIHVHSSVNDYVVSWLTSDRRDSFYDSAWLSDHLGAKPCAGTRLDPFTQERIISFTHPLYRDDVFIGTAVFNLDYHYVDTLFRSPSVVSDGAYIITAPDETVLYATDPAELGKPFSEIAFSKGYAELGQKDTGAQSIRSRAVSGSFQMSYTSQQGLTLYAFVESGTYSNVQSALYKVLILGLSAVLLMSLLLAVLFSFRLYSYVLDIIESFQHPDRAKTENRESGMIRSGILSYIDRQQIIESEFAANLASLRKAQLMALQMQITPHFLLNTLQLINLNIMRQMHQDNDSTKLIVLLSDILRNALSTKEYLTDFSSEIRLAKKYLEIESIRKQGFFESSWDVDPRIEQMSTVRCTLQPLLENCIQHGLSPTENTSAKISIRITLEEEDVCVVIEDNGSGIPPQKLEDIRRMLSLSNLPETIHIGLCNVSMRVRLIFGVERCLSIESTQGVGTRVTLRFPAIPFYVQKGNYPARKEHFHVPHDYSR